MVKFTVAVECAIEYDGKILLIKRPPGVHAAGLLAFPGGGVEISDGQASELSVLQYAIRREVSEEVGLVLIDPIQFVTSHYFVDMHGNHVVDVVFYTKLVKTNAQVEPNVVEVPSYVWLTHEQIMQSSAPDWLKADVKMIATFV